ncbi:MAG TPA: NAD(P)H-binding protein [Puia sp.]|nr:NAD(P)H-binding protein [Puia sp.]
MQSIFITGGTGYIGTRLIKSLLERGYEVKALVRKGSENKLQKGAIPVIANAFDASTFQDEIPANAIFVQLLGVPHPGPKKKEFFKSIDLASALASGSAAKYAGVSHFIYVSVAQTNTKIMKDYQECRAAGEAAINESGLSATFIRPWYVIGPNHYWPLLFQPIFKILEFIPKTSQKAKALKLVYLKQMLNALTFAVENPATSIRIIEIDEIRKF